MNDLTHGFFHSCFMHDCRNSIEFFRSTGLERTRSCYANARRRLVRCSTRCAMWPSRHTTTTIKDFSLCFHILCFHYAFIMLSLPCGTLCFMLYASITPIWTHLHAIMLLLCRCVQIGVMEKTSPGRHWWIFGVMRLEPGRL